MFGVFFITIFVHQFGSGQASSFFPLLASNGSQLCAVGNVSYTMRTDDIIGIPFVAPGATKCGFFCTGMNSRINCTGFNYLISGLCQFFSDLCIAVCSQPGCTFYQVKSNIVFGSLRSYNHLKFSCKSYVHTMLERDQVHFKGFCR